MNMTSYHSKLVGVTFEGRQDVIATITGDELLRFRREPDNEYDSNAVAVDVFKGVFPNAPEWLPIGYIARNKNSELAELLTNGKQANIVLKDITGGGDKAYGVNVYIEYEKERQLTRSATAELVKDFFGNEIFYDPIAHTYSNALGEVYLSGSAYAAEEEFDAEYWADNIVTRYGLKPGYKQKIMEMWEVNGEASRSFGTALHAAIELYGKFYKLADVIDMDLKTGRRKMLDKNTEKNSAMSKLPYLKNVVIQFFTPIRKKEKAYYEVLVVDHKNKRAGRIDRLVKLGENVFEVKDMKTNNKMGKADRDGYAKQLSFYADLLLANGAELGPNPTTIHHWDGTTWKDVELAKINTL